jgi:DNA replication protein DnaC
MAYSTEVIQRARERLAQARADRESENLRHLAEAYRRVPRLKDIDLQLRRTMAKAAQAVFTQGGDVQAAMEQAKNENLALQMERRELIAAHFEPGYLDDSPICAHCGGHGYVGSSMCECLTELCRQEQKKELSLLSSGKENFSQFKLEYYSEAYDSRYGASPRQVMELNFRNCRSYATTFTPNSGNLLFVGGTGLGKTFLAACIARTVADRGYSVMYETAAGLFSKLERAKFGGTEEDRREAEKYSLCDLLIIDDLGTEMAGQFVTAALYSLMNDRLLENKPMVITTNLNVEDASKRYNPQIASRLYGDFVRLTFVGSDIRVLRNRGF